MNTQTINRPTTLRELGDLAGDFPTFMRLLEELGPWPTPPADYVMTKGNEDRWTGTERLNRGYIVTPVWNATTDSRTIDLWTSKDPGESDAHLTPQEALQLAADLLQLANEALADEAAE